MVASETIDALLRDATEGGRIPGVVAAAAAPAGLFYQGAAGVRMLGRSEPMTADTVFAIASMTKAVTAVAAMQLVEQGKLALDQPAGDVVDGLRAPMVLEGFDEDGSARLRPARRPVTLRHLLTHTSGFSYDTWNLVLRRYAEQTGVPMPRTGMLASLNAPLLFDPGERWEYSISIDWAGRMVEAVSRERLDRYFHNHIFGPLGMDDTGYTPTPEQQARLAAMHRRKQDGSLEPLPAEERPEPEFFIGGGGLYSTAGDYLVFLRMLLAGGALSGERILRPETVALMGENHIGDLLVQPLRTAMPDLSNDVELFPGMAKKWGLSFLINTEDSLNGRSAGSLAWAGLYNTYYWLDPKRQVAGVLMAQILPFGDTAVLDLFAHFERAVYEGLY
ncbi:MAG: beta-lactamase family protein [Acetobacteraceae bacterium]|nr:beta-lactamase family protein [Acetobacteraceae bacterium]